MTEPKFQSGDRVRHIDGTQVMKVVKYKTKREDGNYNYLSNQTDDVYVFTDKVLCSWLDVDNHNQEDTFSESEIVLADLVL